MNRRFISGFVLLLLLSAAAAAQQRPLFDPDDFVDPRQLGGRLLLSSRLVIGGVSNEVDDYRPGDDTGFVHLTNSIYWRWFQLDYKHTAMRSGGVPPLFTCACNPPQYFPTPPAGDALPAAPRSSAKDMLQFAGYYALPDLSGSGPPIMLRIRGTWLRQQVHTDIASLATGNVVSRLSGRDESFGLEGDTYLHVLGRNLFGTLRIARTTTTGTPDARSQTEFTYSHRFPGFAYKQILFRTILTVGTVTNRGGTAIDVVNPYFEAFLHESRTRVNFHLVYSPQALNSGARGWETHHQVALFADWGVVRLFGPHP